MKNFPENKSIVLFDGVCNLCNKSIQFIIKHDKKDQFRFASLQSEVGKQLLKKFEINRDQTDSIVLINSEEEFYVKSAAALHIAKKMKYYSWMRVFLYLPKVIRDKIYDLIAKNRYKWFGKRTECMIPTPELKAKFLEA